jgi:hypothetical protein
VRITGAWEGMVQLVCADVLARPAAAVLFGLEVQTATPDLVHDALGELTNITGGNLKALLPEPCYLSLPAVTPASESAHALRNRPVLVHERFRCGSHFFAVAVVEQDEAFKSQS